MKDCSTTIPNESCLNDSQASFPREHAARTGTSIAARARALQAGVTLVEVIIVVAILAMVASGVALVALPKFKEAQVQTAKTGAQVIRQAVHSWQISNSECPTVSQLVSEKLLDKGTSTTDPWGKSYQLSCDNDEVTVTSAGPDKKSGTADDISIPKAASAEEAAEK